MFLRSLSRYLVVCGLFGAMASQAHATQVLNVPLDQMARESKVIIHAQVGKQRVQWDDTHTRILTLTDLKVLKGLRGATDGQIMTVYQVGGTLDGVTFKIPGAIRLVPGEEIVLFGQPFNGMVVSYGMGLGKFRVFDQGGKRFATAQFGDVSFVKRTPTGKIVPEATPADHPVPLAALFKRVRTTLIGGRR